MFNNYKPTWLVSAIYQITPEQLHKHGIKAVLTDLDNTLIAWNNPEGTVELREWIQTMKEAQIPVIVVSNNSAERIDKVVRELGLDYVPRALKPLTRGFKQAHQLLKLPYSEMVMVGDQLMTDIHGANRAGIRTILVKPVVATDSWKTNINRFFERKIWKHLETHHEAMEWKEGI